MPCGVIIILQKFSTCNVLTALLEIKDLLTVFSVFLEWNGPAFSWHDRSEILTMVLVLVLQKMVFYITDTFNFNRPSIHTGWPKLKYRNEKF